VQVAAYKRGPGRSCRFKRLFDTDRQTKKTNFRNMHINFSHKDSQESVDVISLFTLPLG